MAFEARTIDSNAASPEAARHLPYEQIAAYVDDHLAEADREIAEAHIESCRLCSDEVVDLQDFTSIVIPAPVKKIGSIAGHRSKQRVSDRPAYRFALQAAAAIAVMLLGGAIVAVVMRSQLRNMQSQVAEMRKANAELQQEYDAARSEGSELQDRLARVQQGQSLLPGPPEAGSVVLNDGGERVSLSKTGELSGAGVLPQSYVSAIRSALVTGRLDNAAALADVAGKAGTLIGGHDEGLSFALLGPVGTVVLTDRPTFRWSPVPGATSYKVAVHDADFNAVGASTALSATTWKPPNALTRGRVYTWQVTAVRGQETIKSPVPPAPEAKFRILDAPATARLERASREYKGRHLTLGVLYAQAGLQDDAERELRALVRANPGSAAARQLLTSLRAATK